MVSVTTAHHIAPGRLPNCSGWRTRSSKWAAVAASISTMPNRISTLAIGARSLDTTRESVPKAGACSPSLRIQRMQNTDAVSEPVMP